MKRRQFFHYAAAGVAAVAGSGSWAQGSYPSRPIKVIVPWSAGGVTDVSARVLAERMSRTLGQPMVIYNRAGAGGKIGTDMVAKAPADGYTLLFQNAVQAALPTTDPHLDFDPVADFVPIAMVSSYSMVLLVHPSVPAKNIQEFIAYARRNPGKLSYGSSGPGSGVQFAMELFKTMTGTNIVHVPYMGSAQSLQDTMAGNVQVTFDGAPQAAIDSGQVRPLAVTGNQRDPRYPQLPTLAEAGLRGYNFTPWQGFLAPAGVPREVVDKVYAAAQAAVADPAVRARFKEMQLTPITGVTPEQFAIELREDVRRHQKIAADAKLHFH